MVEKFAKLIVEEQDMSLELPIQSASIGQDVIEVSDLVTNGYFTYDPGFLSTAACSSAITYIDGEKGVLLHRGYPIEQLAKHKDHLEVCYVLLYGELPTESQYLAFKNNISQRAHCDKRTSSLLSGFSSDAHPMAMLIALVSSIAASYQAKFSVENLEHCESAVLDLIAKIPILAAMTYRHHSKKSMCQSDANLSYGENFLQMMFKGTEFENRITPTIAKAIDRIFLLHADHEQNASTSTVRLAGSTGANPFACICAGIAALWGPAHGGANEAVLNMLREIGDTKNIPEYIKRAKDKDDPFRLMGFGHRVYKNFDPRARVMKETCDEVLSELGIKGSKLLEIAKRLEEIALEDDYFVDKKLYPNVDFYSGIILQALGIPSDLFTVIFATGRSPGWGAHWYEMHKDGYRLGRPRQLYTGHASRDLP